MRFWALTTLKLVGALLRSWKLPNSHIETVEFHTCLAKADEFLLDSAIVHLASVLVLQEESKKNGITAPDFDAKAWEVTDLSEEDLEPIKLEAKQSMLEVLKLLFTKA